MTVRAAALGGVQLHIAVGDADLRQELDALLGPSGPLEAGVEGNADPISLTLGSPPALLRVAGQVQVVATPATVEAGLRGALGAVLDGRGGALLHGAGVVVDGRAVLFIAPSEGGKTTLCGKVAGRLPVLSDETVLLHLAPAPELGGSCFWSGPPLPSAAGAYPLGAVCVLHKGGIGLRPITRPEALAALLAEWHLPERPGAAGDAMDRAASLLNLVPAFALHSTLESDPLPDVLAAARGAR